MRVLLKFWIPLIAILALFDFGVGTAMKKLYSSQTKGDIGKMNHLIHGLDENLIFMGSSKTEFGYHPVVFEEKTGVPAYNAGFSGKIISYHYALLELILMEKTPEHIILDITDKDLWDLGKNEAFEEISILSPFYGENEIVDSLLLGQSFFEQFKLMSSIYPYNSKMLALLKKSDKLKKGYMKTKSKWKFPLDNNQRKYTNLDEVRVGFLESFIRRCKEKNVKLTLVFSPVFMISDGSELDPVRELAARHHVPLIDMYQHQLFLDHQEYFKDKTHLNTAGATRFTELLVEELNNKALLSDN